MGAHDERHKRLNAATALTRSLVNLNAVIEVFGPDTCRIDMPADSIIALQRAGDPAVFTAQVNAYQKEIAYVAWVNRLHSPGKWPPTPGDAVYLRLKSLGTDVIVTEKKGARYLGWNLPPDTEARMKKSDEFSKLMADVTTYREEIVRLIEEEEARTPIEPEKLDKRLADVMDAFELVLIDHRFEGVKVKQVWKELSLGIGYSSFCQRVRELVQMGLLTLTKSPKSSHNRYHLATKYKKMRGDVIVPLHKPPVSPPVPTLEEPDLLSGLPYTPSSELQTHLGAIIEALESLKTHIVPTLALLLDLDRDFERYTRVREKLGDLKKQLAGVMV